MLESGTALQTNAVYRYTNVAPGVDARVTILGFDGGGALSTIDTSSGLPSFFQPVLEAQPGESSADFRISFVTSANQPVELDIAATPIDIDGDASANTREYVELETSLLGYALSSTTELDVDSSTPSSPTRRRFESRTTLTVPGIDPNDEENIVTVFYTDVSSFEYRIGAFTDNQINRSTSLGFSCPNLSTPVYTSEVGEDFGDALITNYGHPRHTLVTGIRMGGANNADAGSYDSPTASGDTGDDGVVMPSFVTGASKTLVVNAVGTSGKLQAWFDWNQDNDFLDTGEQVATNLTDGDSDGEISFTVTAPIDAIIGDTFSRFRWSTKSDVDPGEAAGDGEVEDYQFTIYDAPPNIVTNTNDSGTGSLRAAVDYVNANTDDDNITFDIPGAGPHTITLTNSLELLDDGISVDGTTQSGASCGDLWSGTPHTLKVRISSSTGFFNAFKLNGLNISLRGLSITNNTFAGVGVIGGTNQTIACSYLGLTPAGTAAPNRYGVVDRGVGTVIGGPNPGDGNVISSNGFSGIISMIAASASTIEGNFIGTNPLGLSAMPNGQGIGNDLASGSATWDAVQGNLISGNSGAGIHLTNDNPVSGSSGDAVISGNYIGVDRTGNTALANGGDGIHFEAGSISGVTIGGTNVADRNIISGNTGDGIAFSGVDTITILGNSIGLGADGTTAVGNTGTGVSILAAATGVQIGNGSSSGANVITNNGADGIYSSGDDFFALANNIYGNGGLGIDLGGGTEDADGVTANDSGDGDAGPNNLLNFPIINELSVAGSTLNYDINLDAPANTDGYRVDFYKSTEADASSYGEGEIHLGFVDITHAGGDLNFTGIFTANDTVAEGNTISATTTRKTVASSYDISSEFSLTYSAIASAAELTASKSVTVYDPSILGLYILPGNDVIYSLTVTNIGNGNADADTIVLMENVPPEISFYNGDMDDGGPILNPVSFVEGETTGLTFTYGTDVAYSNSGTKPTNFAACNFIPAAGYNNNVTYICVNPKGEMAAGDPDPNFTIAYRARVN
ncbi:hypothetical protein GCM10009069_30240 [Algimonas arctica]|uniref:GEVED domain-containing protein n=1 Tax=Algimonas arctica TaxID=1479486 RepID=A0A8J3CVE6_9PROT|nr:hypothetical protein GCM10009069_30240 [Algimonas arctica]